MNDLTEETKDQRQGERPRKFSEGPTKEIFTTASNEDIYPFSYLVRSVYFSLKITSKVLNRVPNPSPPSETSCTRGKDGEEEDVHSVFY
jgi:hypothetical protein